jgi:hypothetical protein
MKQPAPQGLHTEPVCNCHDCTQARSLLGKAWLIEYLERIDKAVVGPDGDPLGYSIGLIEQEATDHREAIAKSIYDRLARIEQSQATLATVGDVAALAGKTISKAHVGTRLRQVAEQYGAGGHTHREKMLKALADEFDPEHKMTVAVAITDTKRGSSQAKVRGDRGRKR